MNYVDSSVIVDEFLMMDKIHGIKIYLKTFFFVGKFNQKKLKTLKKIMFKKRALVFESILHKSHQCIHTHTDTKANENLSDFFIEKKNTNHSYVDNFINQSINPREKI